MNHWGNRANMFRRTGQSLNKAEGWKGKVKERSVQETIDALATEFYF